jgi:uncharacterized damage-inducible protein DinB
MISLFRMLAAYNDWANRRLFSAAAELPEEAYRADRGAFFKSVHGTLNHLLVTDRIWMKRFTGQGESPERLDAILFEHLLDLEQARKAEDARISAYVDGLDEAALALRFRYRRASTPEEFEQPLAPALLHVFNHQTHHRGQVHAILTGFGRHAHALDLMQFQRQSGLGM